MLISPFRIKLSIPRFDQLIQVKPERDVLLGTTKNRSLGEITRIFPSAGSTVRNNPAATDVFPAPVLPTTPTFSPARTLNETFLRTRASSTL